MKPTLKRFSDNTEYFFRERCHIIELDNDAADPALSIARARVEPGVCTRWHRLHNTTERYVILSGSGVVELGNDAATAVGVGDVVTIPADCSQRILNNGTEDLIFLALCTPRFLPENYIDMDVDSE